MTPGVGLAPRSGRAIPPYRLLFYTTELEIRFGFMRQFSPSFTLPLYLLTTVTPHKYALDLSPVGTDSIAVVHFHITNFS